MLAVSGLRVVWDLSKPSPERLVSVTLPDGSAIRDTAMYSIVVNDFMAAGGDGLVELARGRNTEDTGVLLRDVISDYIRKNPQVTPILDGRVTIRRLE